MYTPYENFLLWLRSRSGQKVEAKYQSNSREGLQSKYIQETLFTEESTDPLLFPEPKPPSRLVNDKQIKIIPEEEKISNGIKSSPVSGYKPQMKDIVKDKIEDEYKRRIFDVWKDREALNVFMDHQAISFIYISKNDFAMRIKRGIMPDSMKEVIKRAGGYYLAEKNYWVLKHENYKSVLKETYTLAKSLQYYLEPIPTFVFHGLTAKYPFEKSRKHVSDYDYSKDRTIDIKSELPPALYGSLYQFQLKGIEFALNHSGRIVIGDEMGTGKSIQALGIAYIYRADWPLLIIAPSSLKFVWKDEIQKWLPMLPKSEFEIVKAKAKTGAFEKKKQIYIISYSIAKRLQAELETMQFKVIIADEVHYLKNRDARRTKVLSPLILQAKRVILLSGTPMVGRPVDLYNIVHLARPDIFQNFREYGHRYCDPHQGKFCIDWKGSSNAEELHLLLTSSVMIRRLKSEVLKELPRKRRQKVEIEAEERLVRKIKKIMHTITIKEINEVLNAQNNEETEKLNKSTRDSVMAAYRLTGLAKAKGTIDFVDTLIENDMKFVVYAHHIDVLNVIEEEIKAKHVDYIRIDGSTAIAQRHSLIQIFQTRKNCKIGLLSITANSEGITLTAANAIVFVEFNWTPGIMEQAEGRVHRIGQEMTTNIYYLYANSTIDSLLFSAIKTKNEVLAKAIDGKEIEFEIEDASADDEYSAVNELEPSCEYFQFTTKKIDSDGGVVRISSATKAATGRERTRSSIKKTKTETKKRKPDRDNISLSKPQPPEEGKPSVSSNEDIDHTELLKLLDLIDEPKDTPSVNKCTSSHFIEHHGNINFTQQISKKFKK